MSSSPSSSSSFSLQDHQQHQKTLIHSLDQLCYVHCNYCDTILAVSVPSSSLFMTVTVRCGHCTNLLYVNMRGVVDLHPPQPSSDHHHHQSLIHMQPSSLMEEIVSSSRDEQQLPSSLNTTNMMIMNHDNNHHKVIRSEQRREHQIPTMMQIQQQQQLRRVVGDHTLFKHHTNLLAVNRHPEKRQRVPSAYNRFIKEEIQRIKAGNPDITHREAFSTAAKNWAHFPHIHFGLKPDQEQPQPVTRKPNLLSCQPLQEADEVLIMHNVNHAEANLGVSPY